MNTLPFEIEAMRLLKELREVDVNPSLLREGDKLTSGEKFERLEYLFTLHSALYGFDDEINKSFRGHTRDELKRLDRTNFAGRWIEERIADSRLLRWLFRPKRTGYDVFG